MTLFDNATDLTLAQLSPTASAVDSTWAPQFLSIFMPTLVTDTRRAVIGWAADGAVFDPRSAFAPEMIDAIAGMTDFASRGGLFDSQPPFAPVGSNTRGVWLFRDAEQVSDAQQVSVAQQVPESSTLLLMGIGAVVVMHFRSQSRRRTP
jgi:hypothetical protein